MSHNETLPTGRAAPRGRTRSSAPGTLDGAPILDPTPAGRSDDEGTAGPQPFRTILREPTRCTDTTGISHLGGSMIGFRFGRPYDPALPNARPGQLVHDHGRPVPPAVRRPGPRRAVNLLAVEPYGHGATQAGHRHFTHWDSAIANLQVPDALDIQDAFVLGTSQGGWIAARTALLAPDRIRGIIPLGTSMDFDSSRSRELGCWDGIEFCSPPVDALAEPVGDDWMVPGRTRTAPSGTPPTPATRAGTGCGSAR